ncbi:electron transport complex protein RnfD [Haemophilus influenzae 22.1-21]|nr:electron transport complex protein RnfD [Haemophilus influenzae 22.1-21]
MFKMVSSPHTHSGKLTAHIMLWVILAMMPAFFTQIYYFGFGVVLQSALAIGTAIIAEFIAIKLRGKKPLNYLSDFSVALTALILAMAIPPYAPYWIIIIGTLCAVLLGKQVLWGFRAKSIQSRDDWLCNSSNFIPITNDNLDTTN